MNTQAERGDACDTLRQQLAGAQAEIEKYRLREFAAYQALGYSPPVSDSLPHLIEYFMGLIARLQDSLVSIERATGFQPGTEPLATWVGRAVKERDATQKACTEMRDVVGRIKVCIEFSGLQNSMWERYQELCHALSTDCGKDYVPRAELEKVMNSERREQARLINERDEARAELDQLKAQVKPLVEALDYCRDFVQHKPYGTPFNLSMVEQVLAHAKHRWL